MKHIWTVFGFLVAACADRSPVGVVEEGSSTIPSFSKEMMATVEGDCTRQTECELRVVITSTDRAVGAYQGRLRLDPSRVTVLRLADPVDGSHLVNPVQTEDGDIRFAGFSATGEMKIVTMKVLVGVSSMEDLRKINVSLDLVADPQGNRVATELLASRNVIRIVQ